MKYVKQKLLAGFLTAILTVTAIPAWNITNVQAKETDSKYSTSAYLCDENGNRELCVGDLECATVSVNFQENGENVELDADKWGFLSQEDVVQYFQTKYPELDSVSSYGENPTWTTFTGSVPEDAFGKTVVYHYGVEITNDDGTTEKLYDYVMSDLTIHSFGGTKNITFASNEDGKTVTAYSIWANENSTTIPASIKVNGISYKVTAIGNYVNENKKLKAVTIPATVKSIGKEAFVNAKDLKTITINGNVTKIGANAFKGINKKAVFKIKTASSNYKKIVSKIKKAGAPKSVTFKIVK